MKKIILISIIITVLIIAAGGIYFFPRESEDDLRKNIENEYYESQFIGCGLSHDRDNFNSKQDCEGAVRCISIEMSKLVRKEDLKIMSDKMKWSDDNKSTISTYFREKLGISNESINSLIKSCTKQYGYKET